MKDQLQSWLTIHDPALYRGPKGIYTAQAMDTFAALGDAGGSVSAPSNAQVTGGKAQAALATDKQASAALAAAGGNTLDPAFLDLWKKDLVGAAVTLSEMARNSAGYQPQTLDNSGAQSAQYQKYLSNIGSCPLFILQMSDRLHYDRTSSDWNSVIQDIANTFQGIAAEDTNKIVSGLTSLAQAASSKMSTTQTESVFVQNAINVDSVVTLYLYNSEITFVETQGKGYDTKQTTYDIVRLELRFQDSLWPQFASAVAAKFHSSVDDWLNNNSTSTAGTDPIPALKQ